jgi:hypothetical protein
MQFPACSCMTGNPEVPVKSRFYETVTGVNIRFCFSFIVFCFSFGLRCMLFSAGFLFALCVSRLWLCAVWDSVEKSMLPVFGRPC